MAIAKVTLTGDKQVDRLFETLEPRLQKKALRKGTRESAKVVLERAKIYVPIDEGVLLDTLVVRSAVRQGRFGLRRGEIGHSVTHKLTWSEDPFYSHFVEFGTIKWQGDRYLRPALYDNKSKVLAANKRALRDGINEIARQERMKRGRS